MKKNADGSIETMYGNLSPERLVEISIAAGIMNPDKTLTEKYGGEKTDSHLIPYELEHVGKYNSLVPSNTHQKIDKQIEKLIKRTLVEANALRGLPCIEIRYIWAYDNSSSLSRYNLNVGYYPHSLSDLDGGHYDHEIYKDEIRVSVFHKVDDKNINYYLTRMKFPVSDLLIEINDIKAKPIMLEDDEDDDLVPILKKHVKDFPEKLVEWSDSSGYCAADETEIEWESSVGCWDDEEYHEEIIGLDEEEGDHAVNSVIETLRNRKVRQTEFSYRNGKLDSLTVRFDDEP